MNAKSATFGERVRHARISAGLSQAELARAMSNLSKARTTKSLVSQWEGDLVKSPQTASLLALTAITGFAQQWLLNGRGPERADLPVLKVASRDTETRAQLRRAILIACDVQKSPATIADAAIEVFETLQDEHDVPEAALRRIARLTKTA